ncbi:LPXTG cell wall anchor domain-containing protein [Levilactobacillus parabrevis]|uniref:LPXTG cell wall anchor domain-containing protein n=1 Tax=Levilactobacillus parabrevis TaxID=357278 RepID=UPI0037577673
MMKMNWQHGVMVGLFVGGLLVGSGQVVGLADEGQKFEVTLEYYVTAINDGDQVASKWLYATEKKWVTPKEEFAYHPDLKFLNAPAKSAPLTALNYPLKWTYNSSGKPVKVTVKYTDLNNKVIGQPHTSSAKFTKGGKMIIEAPTGYRLVTPEDKNRLATGDGTWNIKVVPLESTAKPTPDGATKPDGNPNEGRPQPLPDKKPAPEPDTTDKPNSGQPGMGVKPTLPTGTNPGLPTHSGQPELPTSPVFPLKPSQPHGTLPVTHPELVVPVDEYPVTVPKPNVIYTPEGPINATNLDHTSELAEHPVTAVDGSAAVTDAAGPSKPTKRPATASQPKPHRTATPLQHISSSGRRLPQTDEQTSKGSLMGMVALAGLSIVRFRRFLH